MKSFELKISNLIFQLLIFFRVLLLGYLIKLIKFSKKNSNRSFYGNPSAWRPFSLKSWSGEVFQSFLEVTFQKQMEIDNKHFDFYSQKSTLRNLHKLISDLKPKRQGNIPTFYCLEEALMRLVRRCF